MLLSLHVKNLALIEEEEVVFTDGLNILTGETGAEGVDIPALEKALQERFYALEIRDSTRMKEDIWARAEEDSLRGMFLRELRAKWNSAKTEEEKETVTAAARFGLAALDHRDLG